MELKYLNYDFTVKPQIIVAATLYHQVAMAAVIQELIPRKGACYYFCLRYQRTYWYIDVVSITVLPYLTVIQATSKSPTSLLVLNRTLLF